MQEQSTYQTTPQPAIDRLFLRMASLYGKHWLDMWANIPIEEVKADWSAVLSRNELTLKTCFKAMDKLADDGVQFPPTQPEFIRLCKSLLPAQFNVALPRPVSAEKNAEYAENVVSFIAEHTQKRKGRNWIKYWEDILAERQKYQDCTIRAAEQALINLGKPWQGKEAA